ncbi:MAG TPA: vitamin K epoxide reductase family protein [Mycobacteriales bacterium]|nr:vitamin K epoxide reductase family protein [Mycobacteriales bacterium]
MTKTREHPAGPTAQDARPQHKGLGRSSSPDAEAVSDDLRRGAGSFLEQRRRVAGLSLLSSASLGVVALYQYGLLRKVPEPHLPGLDADRVDASGEAYSFLRTPDASVGLISYGVTLALAGMGKRDRAKTQPWLPLLLAAKVGLDTVGALTLTAEQGTKHRRFCSWCTLSALATLAMVPQVLPEARAAARTLRGQR